MKEIRNSRPKGWTPNSLNCIVLVVAVLTLGGCAPESTRALLDGKRLIDQGKYPEAVEKLRLATSVLTTNAHAWNYLGIAYHHAGQAAEAEKAYQRALGLNRDLTEAHFNLGCLWLEQNRPDKLEGAKMELTAFTLRRSNSVEGLLKLGVAQLRSREWAAADKSFGEALRLNPQSAEAMNGLGLIRVQRGRAAEAMQYFANALKQQPGYRPALLNQAITAQQYAKDRALAAQKYREYLALRPPPANADAVSEIARQLELELHPLPAPVQTSPPAQVSTNTSTNSLAPKPPATNPASTPILTSPVQTNQASKSIVSNAVPKPDSAAPPPVRSNLETTGITSAPPPDLAHDLPRTSPVPAEASASHPLVTTSAPPAHVAAAKPPHRSFFQRINPLNLFRSEEQPAPHPTPLPTSTTSTPNASPKGAPPAKAPPATTAEPPPAPLVVLRYDYKSPPTPLPGDRTEANGAFGRGLEAYKQHRLSDAMVAYGEALQIDPSFFEAQYNMGIAATESGLLPAALAAYEGALAIQPDSLDARYNFALVLKQTGYQADALNEFEKVLAKYPNEARAHLAVGNLYAQQLRQPNKARPHYLRVLALEPRHPQANAIRYWLTANP